MMTVQVNKTAAAIDGVVLRRADLRPARVPPHRERSRPDRARAPLGRRCWRRRAARYDRDATFPIENFRDMHREGLLGICIPKEDGGLGAGFRTYCLAAAELGRYCGATALSWNMHVCSTLWTGALADDLTWTPRRAPSTTQRRAVHYKRIVDDGAVYSQPFSEGGAAAAGARRLRHRGQARSTAASSSTARRSSPPCRAPPTTTACCAPSAARARRPAAATRSISRCRPTRRASRWWATGTRSACAAPSRARCSSRTCSCRRTRR